MMPWLGHSSLFEILGEPFYHVAILCVYHCNTDKTLASPSGRDGFGSALTNGNTVLPCCVEGIENLCVIEFKGVIGRVNLDARNALVHELDKLLVHLLFARVRNNNMEAVVAYSIASSQTYCIALQSAGC